MKRILLSITVAALTCFLFSSCQQTNTNTAANANGSNSNSGNVSAVPRETANSNVASVTFDNVGPTVPPPEYNIPYEATRQTEWISNPQSPNPTKGNLQAGNKILFNREPSPIGATWQDARLEDGNVRFVHPSDFKKVTAPPEKKIVQVVAEFHTTDDDKDRNDGISESYLLGTQVIGSNQSWGKDLVFRDNSFNLGQTFDVRSSNIAFSRCKDLSYKYLMDNDDGWHVIFRIYVTLDDGTRHLAANEARNIANGSPRDGTIPLNCQ